MIISNLKHLVDSKKISINRLSQETGIGRPSLTALYDNKAKGLQFSTIQALSDYFAVPITQIIDVINDPILISIVNNDDLRSDDKTIPTLKNDKWDSILHNYDAIVYLQYMDTAKAEKKNVAKDYSNYLFMFPITIEIIKNKAGNPITIESTFHNETLTESQNKKWINLTTKLEHITIDSYTYLDYLAENSIHIFFKTTRIKPQDATIPDMVKLQHKIALPLITNLKKDSFIVTSIDRLTKLSSPKTNIRAKDNTNISLEKGNLLI